MFLVYEHVPLWQMVHNRRWGKVGYMMIIMNSHFSILDPVSLRSTQLTERCDSNI